MYGQEMIKRWLELKQEIDNTALGCGRNPEDIRLVAVSKLHSAEAVSELAQAGQVDFGENYVQEALDKKNQVHQTGLIWHFIGHIQTNKAKFLPSNFDLIHTLDRSKLARTLDQKAKEQTLVQPVLIQVNLAEEKQKGGISEKDLFDLAQEIINLENLKLEGLMCMPPFFQEAERSRPYFVRLRENKKELQQKLGLNLPHLSMGMTGDYIQAIEEGATLLRIGSRVFGPRE